MSNDPNLEPLVCPHDGTTAEDFMGFENGQWQCPTCERILNSEDLVTAAEFGIALRYDRRVEGE